MVATISTTVVNKSVWNNYILIPKNNNNNNNNNNKKPNNPAIYCITMNMVCLLLL